MTTPEIRDAVAEPVLTCTVRDGLFVEPCDTLANAVENAHAAFSRAKGITRWAYTNMRTHQPSRTFFGIKTKANPNGLLFNHCPWCGADISAPFTSDEDASA